MAADLKALFRRGFEQGINERRFEVFDDLIAESYVNHTFPAPVPGPEGFKQVLGMFLNAFPDLRVAVEDVIAEGDEVASRGTMTGTQRGEFMGVPASDRAVSVGYCDIWRFERGKAVENWVQIDMLGLMQQLGVVPAPEAAATA